LKTIKCRTKRDETRTLFLRFKADCYKKIQGGLQYCRRKLQRTRKEGRTKRWVGGQDRVARAGLGIL
jgi:hypothetical protein